MMATNEYVEVHNGGYYVAGTRVGLDVGDLRLPARTLRGVDFSKPIHQSVL
jgi:hypothetical protein